MTEKHIVTPIIESSIEALDAADRLLVEKAKEMTSQAYAPYSHFSVGAAIRLDNGVIVTGSNQENAAFPSGICAERSACYYAGANNPGEPFNTIAIAARDTTGEFPVQPVSPCGGCRQALLEYETLAKHNVRVILAGRDTVYILPSVKSLLPLAFTEF